MKLSVSLGTIKTNTYEPVPLEEELFQISSFDSITRDRELLLVAGYCHGNTNINDIHEIILNFYHDTNLIFEGMYLDFKQLHYNNIIICPYLANVSRDSWADKSFAEEQSKKINRSIYKMLLSVFVQFICISILILLITITVGTGDALFLSMGIWSTFFL